MPRKNGLRFDANEYAPSIGPEARQADSEEAVGAPKPESARARPRQDMDLVAQREHLELQGCARAEPRAEGDDERNDHGHHLREAYPQSRKINARNKTRNAA